MIGALRVALVVPTLDEADAIGVALARVPRDLVDRIIVADGGSRDQTVERALVAGAEVLAVGRGYGRACRDGASAAADCDIIVFMDGDGADRPEVLLALIGPIAEGQQDFVIGSRTRGSREPGSMAPHQVWAGHVVGWLLGLWSGVRYSDMGAFRAIRRDALIGLRMREMGFGWNVEMQMRAARASLRILEVPVPYGVRAGGRSKVAGSMSGTVRAGLRIAATVARVAREPASAHAKHEEQPT
ncbi:glycosyltransferase family 2 protein [Lichenifustis flavocetrariae]|uniref:Glycosyltransferase family 2 protein n=1 Tax=Lichenifustis flavocetrariae TaxID=2949735 RepID=A0AA41Z907_9HYPH|nr:glycosyltransferase family 2 protein [Lichenifustis flavocetrariae]MCW6511547.1 glycosyltransferase family 2 protein [Lichenifustis flavocetrariae]